MTKHVIRNRITEHLAIKARREGRAAFTQQEIEELSGITQHTISRHLRNDVSRYDLQTIEAWCKFLDISPDQFFTWEQVTDESDDTEGNIKTSLLATA